MSQVRMSLTVLLMACILWQSCSTAQAETATATVKAKVIRTMSITTQNDLVFGDIATGPAAGTVVMLPDGTRKSTGGATFNSAVPGSPSRFDIQGVANANFSILLPASIVLTGSNSNNMVVDNFTSSPAVSGALGPGGQKTLSVGGTLNVKSNQVYGSYTGQMSVTVDYN